MKTDKKMKKNESNLPLITVLIILLETAIIGTLLYFLHDSKTFIFNIGLTNFADALFPEFLGALWCGFIAYLILWIVGKPLDYYFQRESNNQDEINNAIDFIKDKINLHSQHKPYIPSNLYISTPNVDLSFNKDLSLDLKKSTFYLFKGVSAKYVPIRIRHTNTDRLAYVKVIILDPNSDSALTLRAKDRQKNPKYQGKHLDTLKNEIKDEIYRCIVDLFDSRHKCKIEICFVEETSVFRLEVFEESLYLSIYHSPDETSNAYPETFRYNKDSIFYHVFNIDSFRIINDISVDKVVFENRSTETVLHSALTSCGMTNITTKKLKNIRTKNNLFSQKFVFESQIEKI